MSSFIMSMLEEGVEVAADRAGGDIGANRRVEGDQAHGVALAQHQVGEGGGGVGGILKFVQAF